MCGSSIFLINSCSNVRYLPFDVGSNFLVISKSDFWEETYGLLNYSELPAPIYITRLENDNFSAVLLKCTHKGCEVSPTGDFLICPCHGSEFSKTGKVLQSPAERDLHKFSVRTDSENIYINVE